MDVLGDAIRRDRRSDRPALRAPAVDRSYDYRRFCTTAWKTGNFLSHLGVHAGAGVAVADDPLPEPVLSFYGAALLGAVVQFEPSLDGDDDEPVRVRVVPATDRGQRDDSPSTKRVAYGGEPGDPTVASFERDVWSENPTEPPDTVSPADALLRSQTGTYSHGDVLRAADVVVETHGIDSDDLVATRGSFANPGVVAAGLVAPIVAGGTIALGAEATGDIVVGGPGSDVDVDAPLDEWLD